MVEGGIEVEALKEVRAGGGLISSLMPLIRRDRGVGRKKGGEEGEMGGGNREERKGLMKSRFGERED